ncbi:iron-sulfur cluster assembly accessory protein [Kovacikia minuta CCNUW1]|uniref:HesB/IscA family protein n=1 Tax=Kovacikia minuta TaxID=2931930 RepID=UPI001CCE7BDD|nr:iron-sulfur cluster assembly accessory protein [Kovacikia minuta]UBF25164.1 iron-sulfur cluster assembly accessory protein [Kovacikia minuta CCNUW1]
MIHLSDSAKNEILRLKARHRNPELLFRLSVQPIGCLELSYTMEFDGTSQPGDQIHHCNGVPVVIDPKSFPYINGLALDYSEDLMGGGFRFRNPNATQSCSCGNSFDIDR